MNTYVVEGGVGKCSAFTALVPKLRKKAEVQIYTPYIGCFANNPDVKLVLEQTLPLNDARIMASQNILYSEPYKSNFQFGKQHIIESYCDLHDVKYTPKLRPKLYTEHLKESVDKWLEEKQIKDYILVQLSGGQSVWNNNDQYMNINPNRNYPYFLGQRLIDLLRTNYPDTAIIDCTLPNEPTFHGAIKSDLHWTQNHELLKEAKGFIAIDSCLNHFSASTGTHGVVLWGSTRWIQFGYSHNKNLQFHMGDIWDETKYNESDPRNVMVDPEIILAEFAKLDTNKPVACATE